MELMRVQLQEIVPEDEWDAFVTALKTDLPTTFRITGCRECVPSASWLASLCALCGNGYRIRRAQELMR